MDNKVDLKEYCTLLFESAACKETYQMKAGIEAVVDYLQKRKGQKLPIHGVMPRIVLTQDWVEDTHEKTGWCGSGWDEPDGYELEEVIEQDKFYNPVKAIFVYVA